MKLTFSLLFLIAPLALTTPVAEQEPEIMDKLLKRESIPCPGYGTCSGPSPYCCNPTAYGGCCNNYKRDGLAGDLLEKRSTIKCPGYGSCTGPSPYCCKPTKYGSCCNNY